MLPLPLLLPLLLLGGRVRADPASLPAASLASLYSLTAYTSLPFPSMTYANQSVAGYLASQWHLSGGKLESGLGDIAFVPDPYPNSVAPRAESSSSPSSSTTHSSTSNHSPTSHTTHSPPPTPTTPPPPSTPLPTPAVLQITYPAGSYSHQTGGAEFFALPLNSSSAPYQSMLLSYDVAFSPAFNWVQGGKLPGLRGGPSVIGCSGGSEPTGSDCFSMRIMWRQLGAGEVYAYIPTPDGFCSEPGIICNSDYGTSIQRGSFNLSSSSWNRITLLVRLNDPPTAANGLVELYFNDLLALSQSNLQIRTSSSISSVGGLYFSTFFGGSDITYETPTTQYTYYRDFQLWAGTAASNATGGGQVGGAAARREGSGRWGWVGGVVLGAVVAGAAGWAVC